MHCDEFHSKLDDYLDRHRDGDLSAAEQQSCQAHLESCAVCRQSVEHAEELQLRLADFGSATAALPDPEFYGHALAQAAQKGTARQRNRWVMTGFSSAIAATLMLWVVSNVFFTADDTAPATYPAMAAVTMGLEAPQTLNLVFSSAVELENASMTVSLPPGIELDGFAGQREITWTTSLKEGRNILPLTLVATTPVGGELLATLQHENDNKLFRLQLSVI